MTKCSICHGDIKPQRDELTQKIIWEHGHNAWPLSEGRCCDECQNDVLLARLRSMQNRENAVA